MNMFSKDEKRKTRSWLAIGIDLALILSKNLGQIAGNYVRQKRNRMIRKTLGLSLFALGSALFLVGAIIFLNQYFERTYAGLLISGIVLLIAGLISMKKTNY